MHASLALLLLVLATALESAQDADQGKALLLSGDWARARNELGLRECSTA